MDIQSILGYSQGSPFAGNPYLDIQSNNITMEDTAIPLLLQPMKKGKKKGKAVLAKPFSKNPYLFPSADSVREIPLAQKGLSFKDITGINPLKNIKQNSEQQPINKVDIRFVKSLIPNQYKNKDSLKEISRKEFDKTASFEDIILNPMTALKYKIHGQDIPSNFIQGDRNPLDYAVDAINPSMYANALSNTLKNVVHPINTISTLGKASVNAVTNLVDGDNAFNDGSNEKSLQMIMDAGVAGSMLNPHVNWKNIPKIIEADPLNRATFKLRTGTEHPLYKIVKERIKNKNYNEAAKYIGLATANRLVPIFGKSPIVKKIAENVMSKSSAYDRDKSDIFNSIVDFIRTNGEYTGSFNYTKTDRNLIKNYLYGDETGFTPNNIQPIGLEKYVNRYGKLKSYDLDIPDNFDLPDFAQHQLDINKGIDSHYIYSELRDNRVFPDLPSGYSKENFNNFLKEKIVQNNGLYSLSSDQLNLYKNQFDNIAGHMNHFKLDNNGNPILHIQDLWKFTPEDYNKRWNQIHGIKNINSEEYFKMKQPALLDKVGKPFILSKEINIYQKGGRTPIVVNNPNDPRLKAYNDSLSAYNSGNSNYNNFKKTGKNVFGNPVFSNTMPLPSTVKEKYFSPDELLNFNINSAKKKGASEKLLNEKLIPLLKKGMADADKDIKNQPIGYKVFSNNLEGEHDKNVYDFGSFNYAISQYKKPVQPVVYKKEDKTLKRKVTNVQPINTPKPPTNFEKRLNNPVQLIRNNDGTVSTHKMMSFEADGRYYAAPTIIEQNGKLVELSPKEAQDYAFKNNELKEFKTDREAKDYANNGYKKGTSLENYKQFNSTIIPSPRQGIDIGNIPQLPYRVEYDGTQHKRFLTSEEGEKFMQELQKRPQGIPYGTRGYYEKKQEGGEYEDMLWEDYEEEQVQPEEVVQVDNYKSIQQQAKELKSKQMEVERRLMKRQSFDDFVDFIDDSSESSNYTSRSENYQNNSSYEFKNPYITNINLPSAAVVTGDKEQRASYAMRYLMAKGLTKEAAAGIIGNAGQESSMFHPKVLSGERLGDNNTSYGAFQWHGPRMTKALNWMKQNNKNINSIDTHLDYALEEASQMGIMNLINSAKSPEQAANIWRDKFEKPAVKDLNRANFARQIYNKF